MRIAVFGATGATGRKVVDEALRQRHGAWAFTRRRESWLLGRPGLLPVMGELTDPEAVTRSLAARDAVIVTLECKECKERNYSKTKNKRTTPDKLEFSKYCSRCRKHQLHKETK